MKKAKIGVVEQNIYCEERSGSLRFVVQVSPLPKSSATFDISEFKAELAWAKLPRGELRAEKVSKSAGKSQMDSVATHVATSFIPVVQTSRQGPGNVVMSDIIGSYRIASQCNDGSRLASATQQVRPANIMRLAELVHRAVPYPVLLLLEAQEGLFLSLAHKRWAHNEAGKVVLDDEPATVAVPLDLTAEHPFLRALDLTRQPQISLLSLYQGWMDCLTAWQVALYTGKFTSTDTPAQAAARRAALRTCQRLEQECARLRALAVKERQMAKQVDLNLALMHLNDELRSAREQL